MANNQNPEHNLVTLAQTPPNRFYMCRACRGTLFDLANQVYWDRPSRAIVSRYLVNVRAEDAQSAEHLPTHSWVRVSCNPCNSGIGRQIIRVNKSTGRKRKKESDILQEEKYVISMNALLFWNGHQVVYPDTLQPVKDLVDFSKICRLPKNTATSSVPITFDQTPQSRFYMCRFCTGGLFSWENQVYWDRLWRVIIAYDPVNVRAEAVLSGWYSGRHEVRIRVACDQCGFKIGQQLLHIMDRQKDNHPIMREGRYIIYMHAVLFWNGNRVVYPDTLRPVPAN